MRGMVAGNSVDCAIFDAFDQGRYIVRHEWKGTEDCAGADAYRASLRERRQKQAETLADLTGWPVSDMRRRMSVGEDWSVAGDHQRWWERMWGK